MSLFGDVLVIVPAYNEEGNIERVVEELKAHGYASDYIIVNDGSVDRTAEICEEKGYRLLNLPVNLGLSGAVVCGMQFALSHHYPMAVQYDGDGQHCVEYISQLAEPIRNGKADLVIGSRFLEEKKPLSARMIGSRLLTAAIRLSTGKRITDPTSGMRMYSYDLMKEFVSNSNLRPEPDTISYLIHEGVRIEEKQVNMRDRVSGTSYLSSLQSARYMAQMMFSILFLQNIRGRRKNEH